MADNKQQLEGVKGKALKEFESLVNYWDRQYIALFDSRISEAKFNVELWTNELKHWEETKEIFLKSKQQGE